MVLQRRSASHRIPSDLTDRQRSVLDFIRGYLNREGYSPSIREIGEAFGIRSPNGVMCHLRVLTRKGYIERHYRNDQGRSLARSITLARRHVEKPKQPKSDSLGTLLAGLLGLHQLDPKTVVVLDVGDDSLVRRHIIRGDRLLVRDAQIHSHCSGTIVIRQGNRWILHDLQDGGLPDGAIVGELVGVLRSLS